MLVDLSDLVRTLAGGPNEKRPFDGRLDVYQLTDMVLKRSMREYKALKGGVSTPVSFLRLVSTPRFYASLLRPCSTSCSRSERGAPATPIAHSPGMAASAPGHCPAGA